MKTRTMIFSATLVVAAVAAAGAAFAHQGGPGWGPGACQGPGASAPAGACQGMGPGMGMRGARGPDTAATVATRLAAGKAALKITAAQEAAWGKYAGVMTQLAQTGEAMRTQRQAQMRDGKSLSAEERTKQHDAMITLRTEHQAQKAAAVKDLYAVLTPEQRTIAEEYLPGQRGRHMAGRMGGGMGGHGGHGGWGMGGR